MKRVRACRTRDSQQRMRCRCVDALRRRDRVGVAAAAECVQTVSNCQSKLVGRACRYRASGDDVGAGCRRILSLNAPHEDSARSRWDTGRVGQKNVCVCRDDTVNGERHSPPAIADICRGVECTATSHGRQRRRAACGPCDSDNVAVNPGCVVVAVKVRYQCSI